MIFGKGNFWYKQIPLFFKITLRLCRIIDQIRRYQPDQKLLAFSLKYVVCI